MVKKITVKCSGCGKSLELRYSFYKRSLDWGKKNFYHKECSLKFAKDRWNNSIS